MGRLSQAIAAGRSAVARAETRKVAERGMRVLLAPGLPAARLDRLIGSLLRHQSADATLVVIADHLPERLRPNRSAKDSRHGLVAPRTGFEHLVPMSDLLAVASPASALAHQVRRVSLILARRDASQCLWAGSEAETIVRALMASVASDEPLPLLSAPQARAGDARYRIRNVLFQPVAFRT